MGCVASDLDADGEAVGAYSATGAPPERKGEFGAVAVADESRVEWCIGSARPLY